MAVTSSSNASDHSWHWYQSKHQQKRPTRYAKLDKAQQKQQQRQLQNYCGQLVDKHEEALTTALQKGLSTQGDARQACYLLFMLSAHRCKKDAFQPCQLASVNSRCFCFGLQTYMNTSVYSSLQTAQTAPSTGQLIQSCSVRLLSQHMPQNSICLLPSCSS